MWWHTGTRLPTTVPVMINFMPSWWHRNYGIAFGRRVFEDFEYRARSWREMSRLAHDRFGDLGLGDPDPEPAYIPDDWNNATLPAVLGCEVAFLDDGYAESRPLDEDAARTAAPPDDIAAAEPMRSILRQCGEMSRRTGRDVRPTWTCMGVLNVALLVRGSAIFSDFHEDPASARRLLATARRLMEQSYAYFESSGAMPAGLGCVWNQNCSVPLAGPEVYRAFLAEHDAALHRFATDRGWTYCVHHCGVFDPYAELYRQLGPLAAVDVGAGSDVGAAARTFPEARIQCIVSHTLLREGTAREVKETVGALLDAAAPARDRMLLVVSDLEHGTPDENVRAFVEAAM